MEQHWFWWILGLALIAAELATGTIYLLMVALGAVVAGFAAFFGLTLSLQCVFAAVVTTIGCLWVQKQRATRVKVNIDRNTNVHIDVGNSIEVQQWEQHGHCTVQYRGTQWQARLDGFKHEHAQPKAGLYDIVAVEGNLLVLAEHSFK